MENVMRWGIRARKAKDILVDSNGNIEGTSWDLLAKWQKEFQREFCPSCIYFDQNIGGFAQKGNDNNPNDCKLHVTDIIGQCWNYKNRKDAEAERAAFEALEKTESSPIIQLPDNGDIRMRLQAKLQEYLTRINPYQAPEAQMDTICKIAVLSRVLEKGSIKTWDLSRDLGNLYGEGFDILAFQNACAVLDDYCKTGGKNARGGTGLQ